MRHEHLVYKHLEQKRDQYLIEGKKFRAKTADLYRRFLRFKHRADVVENLERYNQFSKALYDIGIGEWSKIKPVIFYSRSKLHSDSEGVKRFFEWLNHIRTSTFMGLRTLAQYSNQVIEIGALQYFMQTKSDRIATGLHEFVHGIQHQTKLETNVYINVIYETIPFNKLNTENQGMLAGLACMEGLARFAQLKLAYELDSDSEKQTSLQSFTRKFLKALSFVIAPDMYRKTSLRYENVEKISPEKRLTMLEEDITKSEILFDPYLDGLRFVTTLYGEFGKETYSILNQYPPLEIESVLKPETYVEKIKKIKTFGPIPKARIPMYGDDGLENEDFI